MKDGAIGDLALGFGQRLAHFGGQDRARSSWFAMQRSNQRRMTCGAFLAGAGGPFAVGGMWRR
jgi:hypothetical protein